MRLFLPNGLPGRPRRILILALWLGTAPPALAHHRAGGPTSGLAIPSLTHGQMQVVAAHRADVLALADGQFKTDPTFWRLRNFIALQHAFCLWSLMPGSIADEASPFNECTHADLAAVQALLLHLRGMPAAQGAAQAIQDRVTAGEQAQDGPVLCQFSDEPFNTAAVIGPRWREVPGHLPTLLVCAALAAFGISGVTGFWAGIRQRTPTRPERLSREPIGSDIPVR